MASPTYCTLTGFAGAGSTTNLPIHFSYKPPVPKTRFTAHKIADGSLFFQGNNPTAGDCVIEWKCLSCSRAQWKAFIDLYTSATNTTTTKTFTGYWGDSMTVLCLDMDVPEVHGKLFDLSGRFHVTAVSSWGTAS